MNCIGPTARSQTLSPSIRPFSESRMAATGPLPFSAIPMIAGRETPSVLSTEPPYRPWSDSTRPIPASSVQGIWQDGVGAVDRRGRVLVRRQRRLRQVVGGQRARGPHPAAAGAVDPDLAVLVRLRDQRGLRLDVLRGRRRATATPRGDRGATGPSEARPTAGWWRRGCRRRTRSGPGPASWRPVRRVSLPVGASCPSDLSPRLAPACPSVPTLVRMRRGFSTCGTE